MILTIDNFKTILTRALENVKAREEEFSKLDAIAGDGDHGTAIVTAMTVLVAEAAKGKDFPSMLENMGMQVMTQTSGSTSTLLGALFIGMGEAVEGMELDAAQMKAMFLGGLKGVQEQTKAKTGDKTMMDALIPAVETINSCDSEDIKEILEAGASAAAKGVEATVGMKANFGRARNLGERSVGFPDAGATSWACLFDSFAKGYKQ